jgi:hypothetical protein
VILVIRKWCSFEVTDYNNFVLSYSHETSMSGSFKLSHFFRFWYSIWYILPYHMFLVLEELMKSCWVCGSHSGAYVEFCLLGYSPV